MKGKREHGKHKSHYMVFRGESWRPKKVSLKKQIMIMQGVRNRRRNRLGLESCFGCVGFQVFERLLSVAVE